MGSDLPIRLATVGLVLGNLLLLLATWGVLRYQGRSLAAIGLDQPHRRALEFAAGFVIYGTMQVVRGLAWGPSAAFTWVIAPDFTVQSLLHVMGKLTQSVVYEELLFRGYLLFLAIRLLGVRRGVLLSATAFGVYHWFSYGIFGEPVPMVWIFLLTGAAGLLFAYAFARTGSILMPLGLHMGTNVVSGVIFSDGPWGAQLLVPDPAPTDPGVWATIGLNLVWPMAFTALVIWGLFRFYPSNHSQANRSGAA